MKKPNIKIEPSVVLKGVGLLLAGATYVVSSLLDNHSQKQMKGEIIEEVLDKVSNNQN